MGDAEEIENQLEEQLTEQQCALEEVNTALEENPENGELQEVKDQLEASLKEVEAALMTLKRERLLASVEDLERCGNGASESRKLDGSCDQSDESGETSSGSSMSDSEDSGDLFDDHEGANGRVEYMSNALEEAHHAVQKAVQSGQQTETKHFAEWEAHGRGVASKLMARMGYVPGKGLGKQKQGMLQAIIPTCNVPNQKRGLGLDNRQGLAVRKKRKRGGRKHALRKKRHAEKESIKNEEHRKEMASGSQGLFSIINKAIGDDSEAAAIVRASGEGNSEKASSLWGVEHVQKNGKKGVGDRVRIVSQQDRVTNCQKQIKRLKQMIERNKEKKGMSEHLRVRLSQAEQDLRAAQGEQDKMLAEVQRKEEFRKWVKF